MPSRREPSGGAVSRKRLGRGPSRHRARRRVRSAAGPPTVDRGRGRAGSAARAARRAPGRGRRGVGGGGRDRDRPGTVGGGADRRRLHRLCGQSASGGPLPGAARHRRRQERPRRRARAGRVGAPGPRPSPPGGRGLGAGRARQGAHPHPPVADLVPAAADQRAALDAAGVLSGRAGGLRRGPGQPGGHGHPGARALTRGREPIALLALAPSPEPARRLSLSKIASALRRAGRQRGIDASAERIQAALRAPQLEAHPWVVSAYAAAVRSLVAVIDALVTQVEVLRDEVEAGFGRHPDAEIYLSQPGLGPILGARVLAEFGDDPHRYADAKGRKNYSGMAPITRASGLRRVVLARPARNRRLADALYWQAFAALTSSPGARAYYDAQRTRGATHHQALRSLSNRLVGILHGCLRHHTRYDEAIAWHTNSTSQEAAA